MHYLKIILFFISINSIYANNSFISNETCKGCHPIIYAEFNNSAHRKSSIYEDKIHKAVWQIHPNNKLKKYDCNVCHTPSDTRIENSLKNNKNAIPQKDNIQTKEAISCVYCHSITNIQKHSRPYNKTIINDNINKKRPTLYSSNIDKKGEKILYKEEKSFFGLFKKTSGSPFHDIDYTNENFYNANVCMGCHGHFKNSHGQSICKIDKNNNKTNNCISCHMPQVKGSATTIKITKKHTFHGFAGLRNKPQMLAKYIDLNLQKTNSGFNLILKNNASHNLVLHPLRVIVLNIKINSKKLKPRFFVRILGSNNKATLPWDATQIIKNTIPKPFESKILNYKNILKKGDNVEVKLQYYLVNPKMVKKLNLQDIKEANELKLLKVKYFTIK
jgi:hypothetical protein